VVTAAERLTGRQGAIARSKVDASSMSVFPVS
jgi:hypothetical protein